MYLSDLTMFFHLTEKADEVNEREKTSDVSSTPLGDKGNPEVTKQLNKLGMYSPRQKYFHVNIKSVNNSVLL